MDPEPEAERPSPRSLSGSLLRAVAVVALFFLAVPVRGEEHLHVGPVEYRHGQTLLEGWLAYDKALMTRRPGVLVAHGWMGLGEYAKGRAEALAELGYVAFAADLYGKGVRAENHEEAAHLLGIYRTDRRLLRERVGAALEVLRGHPLVDPERIAAIGYCFGGTAVLELARGGEELSGVVSFHGGLGTPRPAGPGEIRCPVLILHGEADPFVPSEELEAFRRAMRSAGADARIRTYPGAAHSFTVPAAGDDPADGAAYHPAAARDAWEAMRLFLEKVFGEDSFSREAL